MLRSRSVSIGCQKPSMDDRRAAGRRAASRSSGSRSQTVVVAVDQIADRRRQHEEAAVDPAAVVVRLLLKAARRGRRRVAARRSGWPGAPPSPWRSLPCAWWKAICAGDIDVGDAVAVGQREERRRRRRRAATRLSRPPVCVSSPVSTSVTRHGSALVAMHLHPVVRPMSNVTSRHVQEVVGEVLLDHVALVAEADDEVVEAVMADRSS